MWIFVKLVLWGMLWIPIWLFTLPFKGKKENCLTWAVKQWKNKGGYLVIRWCRSNRLKWIRWPHLLWLDEKYNRHLQHIVPDGELFEAGNYFPRPWFEPKVRVGDFKSIAKSKWDAQLEKMFRRLNWLR